MGGQERSEEIKLRTIGFGILAAILLAATLALSGAAVSPARAAVFVLSLAFWFVTKLLTNGIRVSEEEEIEGLDYFEHGNSAYPNFQLIEKR